MPEKLEIEPCPYCNANQHIAWYFTGDYDDAYVECYTCKARGPIDSYKEAIKRWNKLSREAKFYRSTFLYQ